MLCAFSGIDLLSPTHSSRRGRTPHPKVSFSSFGNHNHFLAFFNSWRPCVLASNAFHAKTAKAQRAQRSLGSKLVYSCIRGDSILAKTAKTERARRSVGIFYPWRLSVLAWDFSCALHLHFLCENRSFPARRTFIPPRDRTKYFVQLKYQPKRCEITHDSLHHHPRFGNGGWRKKRKREKDSSCLGMTKGSIVANLSSGLWKGFALSPARRNQALFTNQH